MENSLTRARILVAEDEGIIAKDLESILKGMGYGVVGSVSSGKEAIQKTAETRPDLVLMDIVLRGDMDGVEAAEEIRSRLDVPVVFLTAFADEKNLQRAKIIGPFGYLLKPFEERGLRGTIEVALQIHGMEKRLKKMAQENAIMAEIGRVINSSPRIEEVYDRFAEKVRFMISFERLSVNLLNDDGKSFSIPYGVGSEVDGRQTGEDILLSGTATEGVVRTGSSLLLNGKDEKEIIERFPGLRPVFVAGFRSMILVPMISRGVVLGVLNLQSFQEGIYGESEVQIAERVANQIAGAVANARLHRQMIASQEALQKSEERYRRLFEGIPIGLYRSTPGGKLLDANPAMARLLGYDDVDSLIREDMANTYVHPEDREMFKARMEEKGGVEQFRVQRRKKDGTRTWVETNSAVVRGPDGAIQYYEGSVQDITEQQAYEDELAIRENLARKLALEKSTLAEIGRIISSTTDIEEVYKSFAGEVKKLLPLDRLVVSLLDRQKDTMVNRFIEGTSVPGRNVGEVFPLRGAFSEAVIQSRQGVLLQVENEGETMARFPGLFLDIGAGLKSALSVPLFHRDEAVGVLHIFSGTSGTYKEEDLPVARSIANQIAGAIVNTQLFNEGKRTEEELRRSEETARQLAEENAFMAEIGRVISSTLKIEEVYERCFEGIRKLIPCDRMIINLINEDKQNSFIPYAAGKDLAGRNKGEAFPLKGSGTEEIIRTHSSLLLREKDEKEIVKRLPGLGPIFQAGYRSIMMVPLIYQEKIIGVLNLHSTESGLYAERELGIAEKVARQIAGAIANAQLYDKIKRAEERLKQSEEHFRLVIDNSSDIITTIDQNQNITYISSSVKRLLGYLPDEVRGKKVSEFIHADDWKETSKAFAGILQAPGVTRSVEHRLRHQDGTWRVFQTVGRSLFDDPERPIIVINSRDITQTKHLERQLGQAQKLEAVGQLAAGIAHEINTPTQYVGDNTRFLQESFRDLNEVLAKYGKLLEAVKSGEDGVQAVRELEEIIKKVDLTYLTGEVPRAISQSLEGVDRVTKIVRAMKEFSHPGVKEKTLADLNKAIENTVTVSRNEWKYVADMITELDSSLPAVPCLVGEFNQVVLNIIINAAHAIQEVVGRDSGRKGTIRVSTHHDPDWVEVRIGDTGGGIPEDIRSRIFDPFFTTKGVGKGTGQGLAIAHSVIMDKHGGTLHFETEMGKGTTFFIRLPLHPPEEAKREKK